MSEDESKEVFLNKTRFTKMVEETRLNKKLSYIDSVLDLCEVYKIDEVDVKKFISDVIKQKIESEAMGLNLIPRNNSLPI